MGKAVNIVYSSTSSEGMIIIDGLISIASDDYSVRGLGLEVHVRTAGKATGKGFVFRAVAGGSGLVPVWHSLDLPSTASLDASTGLKVAFLSHWRKEDASPRKHIAIARR